MAQGSPPRFISEVIGVAKAYSTSVGGGPFPTELSDDDGDKLRQLGEEYGATTRRPRRCGWFDAVALRYAVWLNGLTALAVTKLDVLDSFDKILLCTAYRLGDQLVTDMPDTIAQDKVEPVYEEWRGWKTST